MVAAVSEIVTCGGNWDFTFNAILLCGNLVFFLCSLTYKVARKEVVVITMCFIDEQNCEGVKMKPLDVDPCSDVFSLGCHISGLSHLLFNKKCT